MRWLLRISTLIHALITTLFVAAALILIVISANTGILAIVHFGLDSRGAQGVIEAIGLLAAAVVAVQIAQTIGEEEVIRQVHVSAPTRVRRYLSRFMVVIGVALAIEGLVATFKALHEDMQMLPYAAGFLAALGVLLTGWGLFIRFNRAAEDVEPEAMEEAKREDEKLQ